MWSDEERQIILETYRAQCEEGLTNMEQALLQLELCPDDNESIHAIFRICHTLKGDSGTLGFTALADFAHLLEDILAKLRDGQLAIHADLVSLLLTSVDALRSLVNDAIEENEGEKDRHASLIAKLRAWQAGERSENAKTSQKTPQKENLAKTVVPSSTPEDSISHKDQTLRIRVETLDRLLNLTGEIAIGRSYISQLLSENLSRENLSIFEAHQALDPLYIQLQEEVMKVRMVPIGPLFRQYLRTVRDLGVENGKQVRMITQGEDAELDTTVIEHLRGCLGHMIRNAIAHGIETPEKRIAQGKDPCGLITLRARHEGSNISVQVSDDGAGLDYERILERARATGFAGPTEALSEFQLSQFIFEPGFSTAEGTTQASGRGVGMDAVRNEIESLGGSVSLESESGKGCTITAMLPLTLAIVDGFTIGVGGDRYVIPLASVTECIDLPAQEKTHCTGMINLRGKALPYIRLRNILGVLGSPPNRENIVVIRHRGENAGIVVDELFGESQIVIKPLDRFLRDMPGLAGSTILGDGNVALILDISALLSTSIENGLHQIKAEESSETTDFPDMAKEDRIDTEVTNSL